MFRIKNVSGATLDLTHVGIILAPNEIREFDDNSDINITDFTDSINNDHVVLVDSGAVEISAQESKDFVNAQGVPAYENPNPTLLTAADVGAISSSSIGQVGGVASLNAEGKIPISQLPARAIPSVHVVQTIADRDALTVEEADEAIVIQPTVTYWIYSDAYGWIPRDISDGDVSGGETSTDNEIAIYSGTGGKLIKQSGIRIVNGNILIAGLVDGRDISMDGGLLDSHTNSVSNPHNVTRTQLGAAALNGSSSEVFKAANPIANNDVATKNYVDTKPNTDSIYGSQFHLFQSLSVSTTTDSSFQTKLEGELEDLPTGKYKITLSYGYNADTTNQDFESIFQLDGSQLGQTHKEEMKDSGGSFSSTGSSQKKYVTRTFYQDLSGDHTLLLQWRIDSGNNEASIWDATIEVIRVS